MCMRLYTFHASKHWTLLPLGLLAKKRVSVSQIVSSVYQWFVCSQVKLLATHYFSTCVSNVTWVKESECASLFVYLVHIFIFIHRVTFSISGHTIYNIIGISVHFFPALGLINGIPYFTCYSTIFAYAYHHTTKNYTSTYLNKLGTYHLGNIHYLASSASIVAPLLTETIRLKIMLTKRHQWITRNKKAWWHNAIYYST